LQALDSVAFAIEIDACDEAWVEALTVHAAECCDLIDTALTRDGGNSARA